WVRDVMVPREARRLAEVAVAGRVESQARLEGLRDATAHLQYAARSWYAAAGGPAINGLAVKARAAKQGLSPAALRPGQVIDFHALMSAQSLGWYGPLNTAPKESPGEQDDALIYASDNKTLLADLHPPGYQSYYEPLTEMGTLLPEAVISIEDHNFYSEPGIDPQGIMRASIVDYQSGSAVEGASTITQQL